jgi:hypothetical protein
MSRSSTLHRTSEMQVTECFSNLLFSIRTHFAVDSALLEELFFPQPPFIVAAHIICKRVSHRSWTAVTVISRLQFAIQSLGHCGCTKRARNRVHRSARMHSAPTRDPPRATPRARTAFPRAPLRVPLRAHAHRLVRTRAAPRTRAQRCRSADVPVLPCGPCMLRKVRNRTCLGWERKRNPNSPVPPHHSHLLPLSGLAGGRRCSSRRAPRPAHPETALAANGLAGARRPTAAGPARGGCRYGRPAPAAGTAGPGRPAAAAGTAGPRRLLARYARGGCTKMDPKMPEQ